MENYIEYLIIWPVIIFIISLFLPKYNEKWISGYALTVLAVHFIASAAFVIYWMVQGSEWINIKEFSVYRSEDFDFYIDFFFDHVSAVFLMVGSFITFLVITYSRYYMHRESGYKRYFNTVLLFYAGYILTIVSGNMETLFIGWEILGLTSFLLIAFYRERYLPVKNAFKVFSIYRIGDVGILLAIWASHHLWHENISFYKLQNFDLVHHHLQAHSWFGIFISLMLLIAASAKSAQFPFSSWLPRAMEGPTPSSAIFYGSLSVHLGAFLLMRTMNFWEHQISIRILIGLAGFFTAVIAVLTARVQSSIKSQIAYASISQIGLIFVELSLGWTHVALVHFAGNAFLRTYQLLVSPSAVSYLIREQFYNFVPQEQNIGNSLSKKLEYTIYLMSIKEWNMDYLLDKFIWTPLKDLGKLLRFINVHNIFYFFLILYSLSIILVYFKHSIPVQVVQVLPSFFAAIGLLGVFRAYAGRINIFVCWFLIIMNHFWIVLAISFNDALSAYEIGFYLSGVIIAAIAGTAAILHVKKRVPGLDLNSHQGYVYEYPKTAMVFLLSALGIAGFPISLTFVGEDIIFSHVEYDQVFLAFVLSLGYIISGIALIRIYSRIFLGPHAKSYHETAIKAG
jgi:NADH:ubiquinone oxidoreductase subunit 5 (subunit L)/multisubunit Na+/H+ antiporter MnhA subunit